jgi:hypothetical protein
MAAAFIFCLQCQQNHWIMNPSVPFVARLRATLLTGGLPYSCRIEYDTLESLSQSIFDLDSEESLDAAVVTLSDGRSFLWNASYAHMCFAHGRLSVEDFVKHQFSQEFAV